MKGQISFPIFMLHYIDDGAAYQSLKPYSLKREKFAELLDLLIDRGWQTIDFRDLRQSSPGGKKVILTFDDCDKKLLYLALPELEKRNMRAVFFMPTAHIGGSNEWDAQNGRAKVDLMEKADLQALAQAGMEIGSHAHQHVRLTKMDEQSVTEELQRSRTILQEITGGEVISLAYPFGAVPRGYAEKAAGAGYQFACAIFSKTNDRYALRRTIIHDGDTRSSITCKLSPLYRRFYRGLLDARNG